MQQLNLVHGKMCIQCSAQNKKNKIKKSASHDLIAKNKPSIKSVTPVAETLKLLMIAQIIIQMSISAKCAGTYRRYRCSGT